MGSGQAVRIAAVYYSRPGPGTQGPGQRELTGFVRRGMMNSGFRKGVRAMLVVNLALQFALLVFVGLFIIRSGIVEASFTKNLSSFIMKVLLPCMIFNSIASQTFTGDGRVLLVVIGLSLLTLAALAVSSTIVYLLSGWTLFGRCTIFSSIFGNYTYMGMAAAESIFGAQGLFYYTIFTLPVRLVFYAAPSFLMRQPTKEPKTWPQRLKPFVSPPTVAVLLGLVFYLTGLELPGFLASTVKTLGSLASPLGMVLCGMGLASTSAASLIKRKRIYLMVLVRNFLSPVVVIALFYFLPVDSAIKQACAIFGCVPVPSLITAFSIQMNCPLDVREDCSSAVLLSTFLCILTLPLWVTVIQAVL